MAVWLLLEEDSCLFALLSDVVLSGCFDPVLPEEELLGGVGLEPGVLFLFDSWLPGVGDMLF